MSEELERLKAHGFELPPPVTQEFFAPGVIVNGLLFLSGSIGTRFVDGEWSLPIQGQVGAGVSLEEGRLSALYCALNHLAAIVEVAGCLSRVRQVVKLSGYVNAAPGFRKAPLVLDEASSLLLHVFGAQRGRHARLAAYQQQMSFDAPLETDLVVQIE